MYCIQHIYFSVCLCFVLCFFTHFGVINDEWMNESPTMSVGDMTSSEQITGRESVLLVDSFPNSRCAPHGSVYLAVDVCYANDAIWRKSGEFFTIMGDEDFYGSTARLHPGALVRNHCEIAHSVPEKRAVSTAFLQFE